MIIFAYEDLLKSVELLKTKMNILISTYTAYLYHMCFLMCDVTRLRHTVLKPMSNMAWWIKVPAAKLDKLSLSWTLVVEMENVTPTSYPLTTIHVR